MARLSAVGSVHVNSVLFSSAVFVGDNVLITPKTRAIAVRRDAPAFFGNEGDFRDYAAFRVPIPHLEEDHQLRMEKTDFGAIQVGRIDITAISTASVLQIGSSDTLIGESRIKQFRQLAMTR